MVPLSYRPHASALARIVAPRDVCLQHSDRVRRGRDRRRGLARARRRGEAHAPWHGDAHAREHDGAHAQPHGAIHAQQQHDEAHAQQRDAHQRDEPPQQCTEAHACANDHRDHRSHAHAHAHTQAHGALSHDHPHGARCDDDLHQ